MPVIDVNNVIVRKRNRKVNLDKVKLLMQSIKDAGLINPITLNGNTLVAGAHRLEAYKRLGMNHIAYAHMGDNSNPESMELIEIDENLIRNELSDNERDHHIARRTEIIAKRNIANEITKVASKPQRKNGIPTLAKNSVNELLTKTEDMSEDKTNPPFLNPTQQKVLKTATSNAETNAKKEVAELMGISTKKVNESISNHKAVINNELDQNKLEELNGAQYRKVVSVAKKNGKEAAEVELEKQLSPPAQKAKDTVLNKNIGVLSSTARFTEKMITKNMTDIELLYYKDVIDSIEALVDHIKTKQNK